MLSELEQGRGRWLMKGIFSSDIEEAKKKKKRKRQSLLLLRCPCPCHPDPAAADARNEGARRGYRRFDDFLLLLNYFGHPDIRTFPPRN
eukprot:scaffold40707_cov228-Skeletonema_dohrnii-CCMP3373.AAC.5